MSYRVCGSFRGDQAFCAEITDQILQFPAALLRLYLILVEQRVSKLLETFGLLELPPHRRRDIVEAEAFAGLRIERDKFVAELCFH